jgi:serine phosphatase RsbU (regulator of sigma subunit)
MAWVQIPSIAAFVVAINLNRRGHHMSSMTVSLVEICVHQATAVYFLGWESAFQYFIPVVAVFPFLKPGGQWPWKTLLFSMCLLVYMGMDIFLRKTIPVFELDKAWMVYFHHSNIILAFGCFALWAIYISLSIDRSEAVIEEKNQNIIRSIEYARRIQGAMLPTSQELQRLFPDHFILYRPRDIVSGDFYLVEEFGDWKYFAVADCTGHGVPGAMMSMICMEKLRDYIQLGMAPDEVLKKSNQKIRNALSQNHQDRTTHDGMEVALIRCKQDGNIRHLEFAGAGRPLWIQRAGDPKIEELKGAKAGIGGSTPDSQEFALRTLTLETGDNLYLFTDGYPDQFSESTRRKITTRRLRELLEENHSLTMAEKGVRLNQFLMEWKGGFMQLDDVLVVGVGM